MAGGEVRRRRVLTRGGLRSVLEVVVDFRASASLHEPWMGHLAARRGRRPLCVETTCLLLCTFECVLHLLSEVARHGFALLQIGGLRTRPIPRVVTLRSVRSVLGHRFGCLVFAHAVLVRGAVVMHIVHCDCCQVFAVLGTRRVGLVTWPFLRHARFLLRFEVRLVLQKLPLLVGKRGRLEPELMSVACLRVCHARRDVLIAQRWRLRVDEVPLSVLVLVIWDVRLLGV